MNENNDYASKGVGAGALTTGIIGTAGAVLSGAFGNIFGGGMGGGNATLAISERDAKIAKLESEKYADGKVKELYDYSVGQNKELSAFLCNIDKRVTAIEVAAPLREQILDGKIAQVVDKVTCCCTQTNAALANLSSLVSSFTKIIIPIDAVCPKPMAALNSWTAPTTTTTTGA